jgi:hypothetical protein
LESVHLDLKKIRSHPPDPPHPFSHRITKAPNAKYIF